MKLIVDKYKNGSVNSEFNRWLKRPIEKTEITQTEADILHNTLLSVLKSVGASSISANQIGINKRACLITLNDEELFLLNPVITERSNEGFLFYESCNSIVNTLRKPVKTVRSNYVVVNTDNLGEIRFEINTEADGNGVSTDTLKTVLVQHEIDHLDGITIKDRIHTTTVRSRKSYGRNDKIVMKSPQGELIQVKYKNANNLFLKGYEIV